MTTFVTMSLPPVQVMVLINMLQFEIKHPGRQMSREIVSNRLDPFGRPLELKLVPLDNTYPSYLLANVEKFQELIEK